MNVHIQQIQKDLGVKADGVLGPVTQARLNYEASNGNVQIIKPVIITKPETLTPNTTRDAQLALVHPELIRVIEEAMRRAKAEGDDWDVIEGLRTAERQKQLVAQGASKTQNSLHLKQPSGWAHACDMWPIGTDGKRLASGSAEREAKLWERLREFAAIVKAAAKEFGVQIEWGGDWGWDAPHFQLNRAAYSR
jgi:peptidoglycan L-alanyl-D-glutamate endopeptidase CwlK